MTFVPDGERFALSFGGARDDDDLVAVGWLDGSEPFSTGDVPADFIERLRTVCREEQVNRTRGWHRCTICPPQPGAGLPRATTVMSAAGAFTVGGAEIRVSGASGARYAAPDMTIHYVEHHAYKPPEDFIRGVLGEFKL